MKLGVRFGSILALTLVFLTGRVHAAPSDPVIIFETPGVGVTQYSVLNQSTNSAQPFAVTAFLVTTTSLDPAPATTNADWTAQKLTFIDWGLTPMGGTGSGLPTWEQYTGLSFVQVTGDSHVTVNGYFNNYTYDSGSGLVSLPSDPIKPGDPIRSGFSFTGSPNSTFLAVGPADGTQPFQLGAVQSFGGVATVPEPGTVTLTLLGLAGALCLWRRS